MVPEHPGAENEPPELSPQLHDGKWRGRKRRDGQKLERDRSQQQGQRKQLALHPRSAPCRFQPAGRSPRRSGKGGRRYGRGRRRQRKSRRENKARRLGGGLFLFNEESLRATCQGELNSIYGLAQQHCRTGCLLRQTRSATLRTGSENRQPDSCTNHGDASQVTTPCLVFAPGRAARFSL
jgi:hypothetical protein